MRPCGWRAAELARRGWLAEGSPFLRKPFHAEALLEAVRQNLEEHMPEKKTVQRARQAAREGKAPTTQAGEFVREEIEHVRQGKHGARSPKQAIAIGLSKARRAGVKLPPPKKGRTSEAARKRAERDLEKGQTGKAAKPSPRRSRARLEALKREPRSTASRQALSKQARQARRQK